MFGSPSRARVIVFFAQVLSSVLLPSVILNGTKNLSARRNRFFAALRMTEKIEGQARNGEDERRGQRKGGTLRTASPTFPLQEGTARLNNACKHKACTGLSLYYNVRRTAEFNSYLPNSRPLGLPIRKVLALSRNGSANQRNKAFFGSFF